MRLIAAACAALVAIAAQPAAAQSLGDVLGLSRSARTDIDMYRYDGCSWQKGVLLVLCRAQRAGDAVERVRSLRRQWDDARRRDAATARMDDPSPAVMIALEQRCSDGDDRSCDVVRRWRRDGTARRVAASQKSMDPMMRRAAEAYERSRAEMRGETYRPASSLIAAR